jgi:hypothetical protein
MSDITDAAEHIARRGLSRSQALVSDALASTHCPHPVIDGENCGYCSAEASTVLDAHIDHLGRSFDLLGPDAPWVHRVVDPSCSDFNPMTSRAGVYLVAEVDRVDARVKIGMTAHGPAERMAALQQGCPSTLRLVGWIGCPPTDSQSARQAESSLHEIFQEHRVRPNSEWFYPRGALADFMANPMSLKGSIIQPATTKIIRSSSRPPTMKHGDAA